MAVVDSKAGQPAAALRLANEAVAIFDKAGAGDEPDRFPQVLELRGVLEAGAGRVEAGRASLEKAVSERTRIFGPAHPLVASTQVSLAEVDFARGATDAALRRPLDAEREGRDHLLFTARYLPERVALAYASMRPRGLDLAISAALSAPVSPRSGARRPLQVARRSSRRACGPRSPLQRSDRPRSAAYERAMQARQRFANLLVRSLSEPVARSLIDEAAKEKEEAERTLAEESATERAELAGRRWDSTTSAARCPRARSWCRSCSTNRSVRQAFRRNGLDQDAVFCGCDSAHRPGQGCAGAARFGEGHRAPGVGIPRRSQRDPPPFRQHSGGGRTGVSPRGPGAPSGDLGSDCRAPRRREPHLRGPRRRDWPGSVRCAARRSIVVPARTVTADLLPVGGTGPRSSHRAAADGRPGDACTRRTGLRRASLEAVGSNAPTPAPGALATASGAGSEGCASFQNLQFQPLDGTLAKSRSSPACGPPAAGPNPSVSFKVATPPSPRSSKPRTNTVCSTSRRTASS